MLLQIRAGEFSPVNRVNLIPGQAQLLFAKTGKLIPGIYMLPAVWQDVVVLRCTNPLGPWGLGGRKLGRWRFVPSRFLFCWFVSCRFIVRRFIRIRLCAGLLFRKFSCRAAALCGCRAFCPETAARCERGGKKRSVWAPVALMTKPSSSARATTSCASPQASSKSQPMTGG